jgi:membrane protein implicated in regulation of membrane protease activity/RNA polymerase subunit RPABC4/transcription elongation factor Spt4
MLSGRDPARFPFEFPSLTELLPGCDPELEKLVGDALKRNPAERLPNAGEFARRLELIARPKTEEIREPNERIDNAGMQYCRQCSSAVPTDSRRCPACGAGLPAFSTAFSMPKAAEPTAASVTVRLCAQCRREIPNDARVCPYCAAVLATQWPSGRQARSSSSGGRAVIAIVAVTLVIGAGLVARSLWESAGAIPWPLWILAGVLLLVLEVHYTQDFTLFCFGVSALIVGVLSIFGVFDIWAQWISFAAISVALLFSARNWLRRKTATQPGDSELENITGQIVIPLEDLPAYGFGKAELRGTNWSAHNATNTKILRGQRCMVMQIKGLTLWIMPE